MRLQVSRWGALTALGADFEAICEGRSGFVADETWDSAWLAPIALRTGVPRNLALALNALHGLDVEARDLAVVVATTTGGMVEGELAIEEVFFGRVPHRPPDYYWNTLLHHLADAIAAHFGATGPRLVVSTACTSGTAAIGIAADYVRSGRAKRALVVGVDALCKTTVFGFRSLGVYTRQGCRPFDRLRDGMGIGEAAGWLLVEPWETSSKIELLGVGLSSDAQHLTAPDPLGAGLERAIRVALGGTALERVDHVNAHATGTLQNDAAEAAVLKRILPDAAVSATKGATGHTLGAAGVIEAVFTIESMLREVIPPVVGLQQPLEVAVSDRLRGRHQRVALSLNLAFGGHNAAVAFARADR